MHLRDGDMMELVTPTIRQGGVNTVYVMVNSTLYYIVDPNLCTAALKLGQHSNLGCYQLAELGPSGDYR